MILLMTLLLTIIILTVVTVIAIAVTGAIGVVLFGDVIVCIFVLLWLIKKILKKK